MSVYRNIVISKTLEIDSIERITKEYYADNHLELIKFGLPFIITDYFESYSRTELSHIIADRYGHISISLRIQSNSKDYASNRQYETMKLSDYLFLIDNIQDETLFYTTNFSVTDDLFKYLNLDTPIPKYQSKFRDPTFWIGSKNTVTPLHKDSTDNFSFQLFGEKEWTIYSIKDSEFLYFNKSKYGSYENELAEFEVSGIDLDNVNYKLYPDFQRAKPLIINIFPGEVLFLPYGWGHFVKNMETTFMINLWMKLENYKPLILLP